jgi:E1A/CREB-binding protein
MGHSENENSCQLCKLERLTFEPPPIYCSPCGSRIKQSAPYYIATISESGHYNFCAPCYTECRGDSIFVNSIPLLKSKLEKRRNDNELEEAVSILASFFPGCIHTIMLHFHCILTCPNCFIVQWVACDKCKSWQHQICALFNAKRNDEEKDAEFTCHYCYIQEINHGLRAPLPQSTVLGAKDLPRTLLSNHIEDHLFKRLKKERQDRAKKFGKKFDEVGDRSF